MSAANDDERMEAFKTWICTVVLTIDVENTYTVVAADEDAAREEARQLAERAAGGALDVEVTDIFEVTEEVAS